MNKKNNFIIVATIVILLFGYYIYKTTSAKIRNIPEEQIVIGAIFSQTGKLSPYGERAIEGLNLALEEIKRDGLDVKIILEDAQSRPQVAVSAFQKLATVDNVSLIIGPEASSLAMAIAPLANEYKIVLFAPTVSANDYTTPDDYTFRNWPTSHLIAKKMASVAHGQLKFRKIAMLYVNNEMGVSYFNSFKDEFEKAGGHLILSESYSPDITDFRTQLGKIKRAEPDALYLVGQVEMGQILKQTQELGMSFKILSGIGIEDPKIKEFAGNLTNGIIYTTPAYNPSLNDSVISNYEKSFREKYNKQSEIFAAASYDTMKIVGELLKKNNTSADQIKEALFQIKDFHGVTGVIGFDSSGDVIKDIAVKQIIDGNPVFLDKNMVPIF